MNILRESNTQIRNHCEQYLSRAEKTRQNTNMPLSPEGTVDTDTQQVSYISDQQSVNMIINKQNLETRQ